ncbi:DNA-binding transcriptional regulator, MarR family [Filimonas lacunae]|uniref:DNA-binding transcriptional regulator, MarR family n=1 Tax=Filimonas lacunae TaxID=477680 RepID=A0A173MFH7_9BACT|nr:MarR family transcriptional regulator [Filimonas lacunae]BAV06191.1 transcriptional regulator, MarR family [Filimonas lacunae]SIT25200.1 DNA-binding transcriptional regulator, MarR family [Filimonas lacunae]
MKIDDKLRAFEAQRDSNWQRLTFILRKHLDIWAHKNVKPYWGHMKLSYMPVLCNISVDGSTAIELARESMIVKQSISRTLKELEEHEMIIPRKNEQDKRSDVLELSKKGKQFLLDSFESSFALQDTYKELVGEKNLQTTIDTLNKLISYHENLYSGEDTQLDD